MKKRNLSGIYFRSNCTGTWEPVCFEDLPVEEQKTIIESKNAEFTQNLALALARTLRDIGDQLDLERE